MDTHLFEKLSSRVQQLITSCHNLRAQNQALQRNYADTLAQYNDLKAKNLQAREKIENLVTLINSLGVEDEQPK